MRLIVVRHGQTECNIKEIWHGWDDCSLTEEGLAQAKAVGRRLAGESIEVIYSSPSRRAMQTAEAVAGPHGLTPIPEPDLRERNAGEYEGVLVDEIVSAHPTIWEDRDRDYWGWRPPDGESFRQVLARTLRVVNRIRPKHEHGTVAITTHMGPARLLISHLARVPLAQTYEMEFPSTGVSIFSLEGDTVRVEALNDATHVGT